MADRRTRLADRSIGMEMTECAPEFVAREGFDPVYAARPLKRFLQQQLETRIGCAIVSIELQDGATIVVDVDDGHLTVRVKGLVGEKAVRRERH